MRFSAALASFVLVSAVAAMANEARTPKQAVHGEAITAEGVGPGAAGYGSLKAYAGTTIKDGNAYPFAREIAASATYDGFDIDGPHLLIEGAAFSSSLDIYTARTVVLRGVSIRPAAHAHIALLVREGAGDVYVLWSDVGAAGSNGIGAAIALRGRHAAVHRSLISKAADGVQISASGVMVAENLIETRAASPGDHNDAIQLLGSPKHITIARNKILNRNPQTSCLYLAGEHIDVRSNYLSGGGWTIYGGASNNGKGGAGTSDVAVTDTIFGRDFFEKSGSFGPVTYWDKANVWRDNRFSDGVTITP